MAPKGRGLRNLAGICQQTPWMVSVCTGSTSRMSSLQTGETCHPSGRRCGSWVGQKGSYITIIPSGQKSMFVKRAIGGRVDLGGPELVGSSG